MFWLVPIVGPDRAPDQGLALADTIVALGPDPGPDLAPGPAGGTLGQGWFFWDQKMKNNLKKKKVGNIYVYVCRDKNEIL